MVNCTRRRQLVWDHDPVSHDDSVRRLNAKFCAAHRYANFGPIIQSLEVHGFRGIEGLLLTLRSPITALSGLNGTGKSTIAQLATCGYRHLPSGSRRRYYVKDFFPVSVADPEPFAASGTRARIAA